MTAMDLRNQFEMHSEKIHIDENSTIGDRYFSINNAKSGWMGEHEQFINVLRDTSLSFKW